MEGLLCKLKTFKIPSLGQGWPGEPCFRPASVWDLLGIVPKENLGGGEGGLAHPSARVRGRPLCHSTATGAPTQEDWGHLHPTFLVPGGDTPCVPRGQANAKPT